MKWPDLMPYELKYLKELEAADQIIPTLLNHSEDDLIRFFEAAAEDENWCLTHEDFSRTLFEMLTNAFQEHQLVRPHQNRVVKAFQLHFDALWPLMPQNVAFKLGDKTYLSNSLLCGQQCRLLRQEIALKYERRKLSVIDIEGVEVEIFEALLHYLHHKNALPIRAKPRQFLKDLLIITHQWEIPDLTAFCTELLADYITYDNIDSTIDIARFNSLKGLMEHCITFVDRQTAGFKLEFNEEEDVTLIFERIDEEQKAFAKRLINVVVSIGFRNTTPEDPLAMRYLASKRYYRLLDMSKTLSIHPEWISEIPPIDQLNLTECDWLTDERLQLIFSLRPEIQGLILDGCTQLRDWGIFLSPSAINSLSLAYWSQIEHSDFCMITLYGYNWLRLNLTGNSFVTNDTAGVIGRRCQNLEVLNLTDCKEISDAGIRDILKNCPRLQELILRGCTRLSEEGLRACFTVGSSLRFLDITRCNLPSGWRSLHHSLRPTLKVIG